MRILITGICGFVGSILARQLAAAGHVVIGCDNFSRPGSETNREPLRRLGIEVITADLREAAQVAALPAAEFVVDAAAQPSVLGGLVGATGSRDLVAHNLGGTLNVLEYCKNRQAGLILLSTSRVYSVTTLAALPLVNRPAAFGLDDTRPLPGGVSIRGVAEDFSTQAPLSLYGATKLASEVMALEYGEAFGFPVFINRCGVLAGAGQFGRADQGIFTFWINRWLQKQPLRYLGFEGQGRQVRDCLHPTDLVPLIERQMRAGPIPPADRTANVSGGASSAVSLRELSDWCTRRFGAHPVAPDGDPRPYDLPWLVLDSTKAGRLWNWAPRRTTPEIFEDIARHAEAHPEWLALSGAE